MSKILMSLGGWLLARLPLERLVAYGFNMLLDRLLEAQNRKETYEKVMKTVDHVAESLSVTQSILQDGRITEDEASYAAGFAGDLRKRILETWAAGESAKGLEAELGK